MHNMVGWAKLAHNAAAESVLVLKILGRRDANGSWFIKDNMNQ
jgi:hypothetical protein